MNTAEQDAESTSVNSDYFLTADLSQRLDLIRHLLANTDLIPFVQAREGSGKTRLARYLADVMADRHTVSLISGVPLAGINDLRRALAEISGLDSHSELSDDMLEEQFCKLAERNKNLLLLLDDADQLAADSLSWITGFFSTQAIACNTKVVVFSAVDVLALPLSPATLAAMNDSIQVLDIPSFSKAQIRDFIEFVRDESVASDISDAQLEQLYRDSAGNPGQVLWQIQFARFLNQEMGSQNESGETWLKPFLLVSIVGFLLLAGAVFYFQDEINKFIANETGGETANTELQTLVIPAQEEISGLLMEKLPAEDLEIQVATGNATEQLEKTSNVTKDFVPETVELANHDPRKFEGEFFPPSNTGGVSQSGDKSAGQTDAELPPAATLTEMEEKVQAPSQAVIAKSSQKTSEPPHAGNKSVPPKVVDDNEDAAKEVPVATGASQVKQKTASAVNLAPIRDGFRSLEWLLGLPDSHYSLQLVAVSRKAGIRDFVKQHKLKGDLVILRSKRKNGEIFALLYGNYASREAAAKAVSALPKSLKNIKAWPRSIASVRQISRPE